MDFSSDGEWIRAEARGKGESPAATPIVSILLAASSGEVCEDKKVRKGTPISQPVGNEFCAEHSCRW